MPDLHPEQFGMTQREMARMKGQAYAAHIWEGMENILGDMRVGNQSVAYDELSARFGTDNVNIDKESGSPYVEVHHGPHSLRYHGGSTLNYYTHGQNVDASTTYEHGEMHAEDLHQKLRNWVEYSQGD